MKLIVSAICKTSTVECRWGSCLGLRLNGKYLTHFHLADNIVLIAVGLDQTETMFEQLNRTK